MPETEVEPLSCVEARDQPIEMPDAERQRTLAHLLGCDACRTYYAGRTCD